MRWPLPSDGLLSFRKGVSQQAYTSSCHSPSCGEQGDILFVARMGVGYGILTLAIAPPLPRLFQDLIIFSGVFLMGLSVLRCQTLVERRITLQDFPLTSLTVFLLASAYGFLGLRLGQSPLAEQLAIKGETYIERGRQLQQLLVESINSLKPAEKRPVEPLPRVWYNHAVLYDAYVEGVPNCEIMARLYISEGTFNRTRRNALRGLARPLEEKNIAEKTRAS